MLLFPKFVHFVQNRMSLIFEIGHKGTKLITFTTKENVFKGIKF